MLGAGMGRCARTAGLIHSPSGSWWVWLGGRTNGSRAVCMPRVASGQDVREVLPDAKRDGCREYELIAAAAAKMARTASQAKA